jgi:hypothetical protein
VLCLDRRNGFPSMRSIVRLSRIFLFVVLAASASLGQLPQNWFPPVLENLAQTASSKTEFSFDHSMLVLASKADQDDDSMRRIIAGVDGISVHRFRFQNVGMYDPRILAAVRHEYSAAGWQHISNAHERYGYPGGADLWIHLDHNTIRNIDVLFAGRNQVSFVAVSGSISPIDLIHLGGRFGISRIQGGVVMPGPGAQVPPADDRGRAPEEGAYGAPPVNDSEPPYSDNTQAAPSDERSMPPDTSVRPDNSAPAQNAPGGDEDYRHPRTAPNANSPN